MYHSGWMVAEKTQSKVGGPGAQWKGYVLPSSGFGLKTPQRSELTGLCRGEAACSGIGEPVAQGGPVQ